ncbi:MAG: LacI family DNA-binding transcriptional regulator [Schleiferilactobacillus harbinensis]|jgi:LacI family sucrose operon transcriptional repressor|uniref:LacI family DNA-binding transcriptional regulator n=2 Tax=Schleiferilactobacillus harbinensis TaxID=304207 RepID=A0ABU7T424_9LACO|nr:LacI family DNA-binding transcriptional regulator [Schleiferilactobacillus harbinensis]MCI1688090.1 LacI family DNA-binding transcriptional regulator [Schleiferilactobacillus harbinensis]MCI1782989.1 LacI family DNA-binding transcriptional regulator [Schleiferilactobacillus harbinensis]MCI1851490.1 LacI family DNA-binding transcriptional regulator [Schleiferilactobacillus harbinensis]MCT2907621.1 LacI family transcriptional regulator [Schleiferilactobacillus harbinensis]
MATLNDVAKVAGVSPTTVSRVINNYGALSEKTKTKVFAAMRELNYAPNNLARSLSGKKTQLVGLIFPSVSNPFFGELVATLENSLFAAGYKTILCNSANNADKERAYLRMLAANQVDGIITSTHNLGITEYQKIALPIVAFDRNLAPTIPIVSSDNYQGGRIASEALIAQGCRHIVMLVSSAGTSEPTNARQQAYADVMAQHGLTPTVTPLGFNTVASVKRITIRTMLQNQPIDGIFCSDDLTALLVLEEAAKLGIDVPTQLKVIGYDGTQFMRDYHPELATIQQPFTGLGQLLIATLTACINDQPPKHLAPLPVQLRPGETLNADWA